MDSQSIKHRTKDPDQSDTPKETDMRSYSRRDKRMAMAKRGIRSLAIAVAFPLSLTLFNIYFFGSRNGYGPLSTKPFWFPPMWALHFTCLASSFLMGLSAWLVWAEGGFHKKPAALSFYLAQLGLGLIWDPIVFRMDATWVGLVVCLAMFGSLVGCSRQFKEVNPIAGDLVKPSLTWAAFLAIVNLKLVFL
ncbi:peripheral-type benzodiazepine receptor, putative [Ricinus communis]|uniref:Peripheral-type benzodiazepine receptor, putative n=1 Tax=Ricinus communis TaxID=3988 RepID=B9T0W2_RICCO|nr:peripheral-type benzodiazepine receptor, putative [Ricinus communis]|eukprot:XP_002531881.1 translocator protein homolog [Ricinus communis]